MCGTRVRVRVQQDRDSSPSPRTRVPISVFEGAPYSQQNLIIFGTPGILINFVNRAAFHIDPFSGYRWAGARKS
jgi:hypothetical protein